MDQQTEPTEPSDRDSPDHLNLRLSPKARKVLQDIAALRGGVSFAEVVRRALGTEMFIVKEQSDGARILLERPDKTFLEVILR